ncbi:MAG: flagellar filament capping protein FliD [Lachnospiraceae bacterium]|nr:flagellar filament capping protein FliD [Lachnospiraceae bacterium]
MSIKLSGMVSGLDTESLVQELVSAYNTKKESYEKEQTKLEWKMEKWKALNSKIYKFYTGSLSAFKMQSNYNKKKTEVSDTSKASVIAATNAVTGTQNLIVKELSASGYLTGAELQTSGGNKLTSASTLSELGITDDATISIQAGAGEVKEITLTKDMNIATLVSELKKAGVNASFDEKNQRFFVSATESGTAADFKLGGDVAALGALGLTEDAGAIRIEGKDAVIELNGATFKSENNSFSVNGLTIEAKAVSDYKILNDGTKEYTAVSLSTTVDVDGIYDMVKGFVKEYNDLIKELEGVYNAESSRGYNPLTSEEKEAMSEDDIEKWENKIKDSLLRRDSTVSSVVSTLKGAVQSSFTVNGTSYSLSSFGIGTLSYFLSAENEKGVLHINGDKDDSATSGEDDKLKTMIATDPEAVVGFFSQLGQKLYDEVGAKMRSTTLSSAFTVYNDKQMKEELTEVKGKISDWEEYVTEQEDYWYAKFAAMEKALAELQSSTSAVTSLFGTGA